MNAAPSPMLPPMPSPVLPLAAVTRFYARGGTPEALFAEVMRRIATGDAAAFISTLSPSALAQAIAELVARAPDPESLPLWGVPFAVKDNIDVAGLPTTAACPAFAYTPAEDAAVVARLRAAGAIPVGKTNLDQFATGLNGTRSPYGAPRSVFDARYISGGSSSGSAVAVAAGAVSFALGTDTAGSGRVPAAFNNIVGIKPTPGLLSTRGMVPACRSLDCVSIFALDVGDAAVVCRVAEGFDAADPFSREAAPLALPDRRPRIGVLAPADRAFFGDARAAALYARAIAAAQGLAEIVEIDFPPFAEIARLLYDGPWVAERTAAVDGLGVPADALDPSVAAIVAGGRGMSATDAFRGIYALAALRRRSESAWAGADVLLLPTAPTTYTVADMLAEPIVHNSRLGTYTNFFNLLDLCGIAIPAGFGDDGLPFGVTLAARGFADVALMPLAATLHRAIGEGLGIDRAAPIPPLATPIPAAEHAEDRLELAVVGAHLDGLVLNHELRTLGATLVRTARTAADYRLFLLPGAVPPKPGLVRDPGSAGPGLEVEIWSLAPAAFARFVAAIPAPLGIGRIALADGGEAQGFLCEAAAVREAQEITRLGGWRGYLASLKVAADS